MAGAALKLTMQSVSTTHRNIREICALEEAALARRSLSARIGDVIATQAGKMWFIVFHLVWFGVWIGLNLRSHGAFDPFPFALLTMVVSLESIFLSLFILMSQNRTGLQAEERNHLDLQINLLSEDENTKMIMMLQALCEHHKLAIAKDREIAAMAQRTDLMEVLTDLKENLPGSETPPA
jgi:uncharacterized membrane protein